MTFKITNYSPDTIRFIDDQMKRYTEAELSHDDIKDSILNEIYKRQFEISRYTLLYKYYIHIYYKSSE